MIIIVQAVKTNRQVNYEAKPGLTRASPTPEILCIIKHVALQF